MMPSAFGHPAALADTILINGKLCGMVALREPFPNGQ